MSKNSRITVALFAVRSTVRSIGYTLLRKLVSYDGFFAILTLVISGIAYLVPFLYYPDEQSNPWPYAYNVIQSQILSSGHFINTIPQLGSFVPFDYGWFAIHHLTIIMFKLGTGLSFESLERILTFLLTPLFFSGFYIFTKRVFGNPLGFFSSLFFLAVPRTYNYLVNVNGEFIGWLILFPALIFFFGYVKSRKTRFLVLSSLLASALMISNLMLLAQYVLILGSYLLARTILLRDTKRVIVQSLLCLAITVLVIPIPVLLTSGNLVPGSSSTIGSLYSSRSATEATYESIYYQKYDWYWQLFVHKLPLEVQMYYISADGGFYNFTLPFFGPLATLGTLYCLYERRKLVNLFALLWLTASTASSSLLLSPIFNATVNAGAVRLLLYFSWPLAIMAGFGISFLYRSLRHRWKTVGVAVFLAILLVEGVQVASESAGAANAYPMLYAKEYKDALGWLGTNTPYSAIVVMNDWTIGEVWMKSHRLSLTESGRGSAAYSTYQDVVTRLDDASTILTTSNVTQTIQLMNKYGVGWILVWNRPSAAYVVPPTGVYFPKFESSPFTKVFNETASYAVSGYSAYQGGYQTWAVIYQLNDNNTGAHMSALRHSATGMPGSPLELGTPDPGRTSVPTVSHEPSPPPRNTCAMDLSPGTQDPPCTAIFQ